MTSILVRAEHLQIARARHGGYCVRGVAAWFSANGMDFREFLRNGYPIELVEACGDDFGNKVAAIAREQVRGD